MRLTTARKYQGPDKLTVTLTSLCLMLILSACTTSSDSCEGLEGTVTRTEIEITGIDTIAVVKRIPESGVIEAVNEFNGSEFSNLSIELVLSWEAQEHRFRAPSTFIQSLLDWLAPAAHACTLVPPYDDYQPAVVGISVLSDTEFNADYPAGSDLAPLFTAQGLMSGNNTLSEASESEGLRSATAYALQAAMADGVLAASPVTPATHVFTLLIMLDDGRMYEVQTAAVLLSGA